MAAWRWRLWSGRRVAESSQRREEKLSLPSQVGSEREESERGEAWVRHGTSWIGVFGGRWRRERSGKTASTPSSGPDP